MAEEEKPTIVEYKGETKGNEGEKPKKKKNNKIFPQIIAAVIANLAMVACGISYAWPTPSLPKLEDKSSDVRLTSDQGALVVLALPLGSIFGSLWSALLTDIIGRKWFIFLTSVPFLICWILTWIAKSWLEIFIGRLMGGLSIGIIFAVTPIYLGEIIETRIRGAAGALMPVLINFGYLIVYSAGPLVDRKMLAIICAIPTIVFILTFIWIPESPYHYLRRKKENAAKLALIWLRGTTDTEEELKEIADFVKAEKNASVKDLFVNKTNRKALLILLLLLTGQQLSGILAVQSYVGLLLRDMPNNPIGSYLVLIILGVLSIVASLASSLLIDRFGRKPLYLSSTYILSLCLAVIGTYFLLIKLKMKIEKYIWAPLVAIIAYFIVGYIGSSTVPAVVSSEIFPLSVKSWATAIANSYGALLALIVAQTYQLISDKWGYHVIFYIFAIIEFVIGIVATIYMPETAGKSFKEIQDMLKKTPKIEKKIEEDK